MLVKLTPGVNFINVLRVAVAPVDPKSVKNTVKSSVSFYTFGICKRKSCKIMLVKLSPSLETNGLTVVECGYALRVFFVFPRSLRISSFVRWLCQ
jgi:hypothetical protein